MAERENDRLVDSLLHEPGHLRKPEVTRVVPRVEDQDSGIAQLEPSGIGIVFKRRRVDEARLGAVHAADPGYRETGCAGDGVLGREPQTCQTVEQGRFAGVCGSCYEDVTAWKPCSVHCAGSVRVGVPRRAMNLPPAVPR